VLEEVRATQQAAFEEIKSGKAERRRCIPGAFDGGALPDLVRPGGGGDSHHGDGGFPDFWS